MNKSHVRSRSWRAKALAVVMLGGALATSGVAASSATTRAESRSTRSSAAAGLKAAEKYLAPYLKRATSIGITTPTTKRPPRGKVVYWLQGNLADIQTITTGFQAATAALGWKLHTLSYDTTNPQALNADMTEAVNQGANFIAVSGEPIAAFASAIKLAKAKHIPVFDSFSTNPVLGKANGIYANFGGPRNVRLDGHLTGAYNAMYWKGHANIVFVNDPDFPVLTSLMQADRKAVTQYCKACKYTVLNVSTAQLASGAIPSVVVSFLQAHPTVNTLRFAIGVMSTGVAQAISSAGLKTKLIIDGSDPEQPNFAALRTGTEQAWVGLPRAASAWYDVDAMARYSLGMSLKPDSSGLLPAEIFTKATVPNPAPSDYVPFPGYPSQFKKLWHVG